VVLVATVPDHAEAQGASPVAIPLGGEARSWLELGGGAGWGQVTCAICSGERQGGVEVRFGVGTWIRPGVGFGAEASGWLTSGDPARQILGTVHLLGEVRPSGGPVHLRVGLGTGHYRGLESGDTPDLSMLALSTRLEIGAEARVGRRYRLRPVVSANLAGFGTLRQGDRVVWERAGFNVLRGGVSVARVGGLRESR